MIEKNELLTLIRESALAQALAQGGNERDFNAVWAQVKDQLGTRYEAEFVVMPPAPMPTTVEVTAEMEDAAQETNLTVTYLPDEMGVVYVIVCAEGLFVVWGTIPKDQRSQYDCYPVIKTVGDSFFDNYPHTKFQYAPDKIGRVGFVVSNPAATSKMNRVGNPPEDTGYRPGSYGHREPNAWGGNRGGGGGRSGGSDRQTVPASLSAVGPKLNEFHATLVKRLPNFRVVLVGSLENPLSLLPVIGEKQPDAPVEQVDTERREAIGIGGLSQQEAEQRIAELEQRKGRKMSVYQKAVALFLLTGTGNAFVEAVAGSGKSTTLLWCAELVASFGGQQIMLAFNKSISEKNKKDLQENSAAMGSATLSSLGNRAEKSRDVDVHKYSTIRNAVVAEFVERKFGVDPRNAISRISANARKQNKPGWTPDDQMRFDEDQKVADAYWSLTKIMKDTWTLVTSTLTDYKNPADLDKMMEYYGIEYRETTGMKAERLGQLIDQIANLGAAKLQQGIKGFDDMTYRPALGYGNLATYDLIFVDEAQDLSVAQLKVLGRSLAKNGRIIFVGDRAQAIYGWRGADTMAVTNIINTFHIDEAAQLPLSICYRCDKKIVEFAQEEVPQIEAREGAGEGQITNMKAADFERAVSRRTGPKVGDLVLCRKNAPLGKFAMKTARQGIRVKVLGRADFGSEIETVFKKIELMRGYSFDNFLEYATTFEATLRETALLKYKDEDRANQAIESSVDAVSFLTEVYESNMLDSDDRRFQDGSDLIGFIMGNKAKGYEGLLDTSENSSSGDYRQFACVFSSIHKAKGDEADTVWWIGPKEYETKPKKRADGSEIALLPWQKQEEKNLRYVAKTRAKYHLIMIEG
jgi:hypothetical protein